MGAALGVLSLLIALLVIAVLAKKQFALVPATSPATLATASALKPSPQQKINQAEPQYKKALESALQQPRLLKRSKKMTKYGCGLGKKLVFSYE